ncbi:hypothetical protein D3C71_216810 [compost metagenome]
MSSRWISKVIEDLRRQWVADGHAASFQAINSGQCEDFAELVVDTVREQAGGDSPEIDKAQICDFFRIDPETGYAFQHGGPVDRELLLATLPDMTPPAGMSWDDLDRFVSETGIGPGLHAFVVCDGVAYDSEAPQGVSSIFDLPFFERFMEKNGYSPPDQHRRR